MPGGGPVPDPGCGDKLRLQVPDGAVRFLQRRRLAQHPPARRDGAMVVPFTLITIYEKHLPSCQPTLDVASAQTDTKSAIQIVSLDAVVVRTSLLRAWQCRTYRTSWLTQGCPCTGGRMSGQIHDICPGGRQDDRTRCRTGTQAPCYPSAAT